MKQAHPSVCRSLWIHALMLWAVLTAPAALQAQQVQPRPMDFAMQLPLTVSGENGVVQLRLPLLVYQQSLTAELADVRVFNASGEAMPFVLLPAAESERVSWRESIARLFPIYGSAAVRASQTELDARIAADGTLISVRSKGASPRAQALSALILDLGAPASDEVLDSVQLLRSETQTYRAEVAIDRSEDLKLWDRVAQSRVDWLQGSQADQSLVNDRIEIGTRGSRYLRIQWLEGAPILFERIAVRWRNTASVEVSPLEVKLRPTRGKIAGDLLYAVPPSIAATQAGLELPTVNTVLPASIGYYSSRRNSPKERFVPVAQATFYRLTQGGRERTSSNIQIAPWSARQWVLRPSEATAMEPTLVLRWYPASIVFTARGAAQSRRSFVLAVGAARAATERWVNHRTSLERVAPGFSSAEVAAIETAVAGEWRPSSAAQAATPAPRTQARTRGTPWLQNRSVVLWAVLILGALVLAAMTWRLYQQMNKPS
jgi:hypothetical protein